MTDQEADQHALSFRAACVDDLPVLVRMLADDPLGATREVVSDPLPSGYGAAFAAIDADPNNELVLAVLDGAVVGMLQITFIPYLTYQGQWRALIEGPVSRSTDPGQHPWRAPVARGHQGERRRQTASR